MGTGIVSIDLSVDGQEALSRALLVLAVAAWAALGLVLAWQVLRDRSRFRLEAASPAALTGIAGTGVLGARIMLLGWAHIGEALLALAFALWLALVPRVLRRWTTPTVGGSFMLTVSTESLAVLGALVGLHERESWLVVAALVAFALGVAAYCFVLAHFGMRELLVGRGDHWVAGGALAIATLACGRLAQASASVGSLHDMHPSLGIVALALWAAAAAWLPVLLAGEVVAPRLEYEVRRWSTVFPFGMYAACSFVVGRVQNVGGLVDFARIWTWVAFVVWLVATAALLRRAALAYGAWNAGT